MHRAFLIILVALWPMAASAEVSDKIPSVTSLWVTAAVIGALGLAAGMHRLAFGVAVTLAAALVGWSSLYLAQETEIRSAILAEQGAAYYSSLYWSSALMLVACAAGLALGWLRRKSARPN